jgi:hypothetical protein
MADGASGENRLNSCSLLRGHPQEHLAQTDLQRCLVQTSCCACRLLEAYLSHESLISGCPSRSVTQHRKHVLTIKWNCHTKRRLDKICMD